MTKVASGTHDSRLPISKMLSTNSSWNKRMQQQKSAIDLQLTAEKVRPKHISNRYNSDELAMEEEGMSPARRFVRNLILSHTFEMCAGIVILINFVVIVIETDTHAKQQTLAQNTPEYDEA